MVTALLALRDLGTEFVRRFNRLEIESAGTLTNFWIEFNSSQRRAGGPLVAYVRNVAVLREVSDPAGVLQRPVR